MLYASAEFGFVELPEEMTTGSSIMPQKRNPDLFELARGRSATALAALVEALAITAKLPSGYHRDLQLLKAPLFRSLDLARATCDLFAAALPRLRFRAVELPGTSCSPPSAPTASSSTRESPSATPTAASPPSCASERRAGRRHEAGKG